MELRGLEPLTPCLQIAGTAQVGRRELDGWLPASNRDIPLLTEVNSTLMARRSQAGHDDTVTDERGVSGSGGGARRVYHSNPAAPTAGHLEEQFERLARQVYLGLRAGVVDCEAVFDLACSLLEWGLPDPAAEELAVLAAEGTDQERIAELARQVLAAAAFEPGFDLEPSRLAVLEEALEVVRSDMQATGLAGSVRLVVPEWSDPPTARVQYWGGGYGSTTGIAPKIGSNPLWALVAVADETQDSVMETIEGVWPVCPTHQLGAHSREYEGQAVWWCNGDGGHVIAAIGQWNDLLPHSSRS